jgi:Asp/Glu/hydantoin racemase
MSKVCILHTTISTVAPLQALAAELLPDVEFMHLVEDALIKDVMKSNGPDADINARIAMYVMCADRAGCDIFMTACSSIGEVVESYRSLTNMTVTRIDDAMAEAAIDAGTKIAVLATVETTLRPTLNLIKRKAEEKQKAIDLKDYLMADAFAALLAGDTATHNRLVRGALTDAAKGSDVIVLAQASMARALEGLDPIAVPILTSPELSMKRLKRLVDGLERPLAEAPR